MDYESCELPFGTFVGRNGFGTRGARFWAYKIKMDDLWDRAGEMSDPDALLVTDILRNGRTKSSLSTSERQSVDALVRRGFLLYVNETIETTFPVFNQSQNQEISKLYGIFEQVLGQVYELIVGLFDAYVQRIQSGVPARLERQVRFVAGELLYQMRMMLLRYALEQGRIAMPAEASKSTIAMYMEI